MKKEIIISSNESYILYKKMDYLEEYIEIQKLYISNDRVYKMLRMYIGDDIEFAGNSFYESSSSLSFEFSSLDPIYIPLLSLISDNNYLKIDDDHTISLDDNYLYAERTRNSVEITFNNNLKLDNKYKVYIKNIFSDCRSKSNDSVKAKITDFIRECEQILINY